MEFYQIQKNNSCKRTSSSKNTKKCQTYASRSLSDTEEKYDTYEKEALATLFCVTHFRPHLYGRKFTLVTDLMFSY